MKKRTFLSSIIGFIAAIPFAVFGRSKAWHEGDSRKYSGHAGDCSIYRSPINGMLHDGICTCGYGWEKVRNGDWSEMYSVELVAEDSRKMRLEYRIGDIILWRDGPIENRRMRLSFVDSVWPDGSVLVDSQRGGKIDWQYDAEIVGHIDNLHERFNCEQFTLWKKV